MGDATIVAAKSWSFFPRSGGFPHKGKRLVDDADVEGAGDDAFGLFDHDPRVEGGFELGDAFEQERSRARAYWSFDGLSSVY